MCDLARDAFFGVIWYSRISQQAGQSTVTRLEDYNKLISILKNHQEKSFLFVHSCQVFRKFDRSFFIIFGVLDTKRTLLRHSSVTQERDYNSTKPSENFDLNFAKI